MRRFAFAAIALIAAVCIFNPIAHAAGVGTVTGMVRDTLGRPVANVQLVLQTEDGHILGRTRSGQSGAFRFHNVPAGTYAVVANKNGFRTAVGIAAVRPVEGANLDIALASETALSLTVATTRINTQPNGVTETGTSMYSLNQHQITALPQGQNTPINQVLLQMPGVVQDDQAQVHVGGAHEDLQWRVNGVMMPMDSFTGFGQIFNSFFVRSVSLLDGILPVTYGYRDAGVLDLVTKDGCSNPGGNVGFYGGQRETLQPSFEYGACDGPFSAYFTGTFLHSNLAFSSATSGPTPIHNITNQGQGFGYFTWELNPLNKLSLITGISVNNSEIPNSPNLPPLFNLKGISDCAFPTVCGPINYPSTAINESLNQDYFFGILALSGVIGPQINYQVAYTGAYSTLQFLPDPFGDLVYQGVASNSFRSELDNTLQTDISRMFNLHNWGSHNIGTGFYLGYYGVQQDDTTQAFPTDPVTGAPTTNVPVSIVNNLNNINILYGVYLQDIWQINEQLSVTAGLREDGVTGIINNNMISPRINLLYQPTRDTAFHAGFARYFQTPDFLTGSPQTAELFANTTAAISPGGTQSFPEKDYYWDAGFLHHFGKHLTVTENAYFRLSQDLIDEGQFGFVPVFLPFNYQHGRIYGSEFSATYNWENLTVR
ncbi:MAG TPA: TonB-dependent receptor, partial [Candidatus Binataceae bacterium]|nr:TonB-dependent receptor [Candidatus Binataceae bacterium]